MKLRKVLLLTAATAALGSMNVISAFADAVVVEEDGSIRNSAPAETTEGATDTESMLYGWTEQGSNWVYYDGKGNTVKAGSRQRAETAAEMRYGSTQIRRRALW